jgi:hypothetical protein
MGQRLAATLIEVLVAILVMALGMIALLTLFPIGALSMAEALKNDRCAVCGAMASGMANAKEVRTDVTVRQAMWGISDSDIIPTPVPDPVHFQNPASDGPGYPILVDPLGILGDPLATAPLGAAGGATPTPGIPRSSASYVDSPISPPSTWIQPPAAAARWFSLPDDMHFSTSGKAINAAGAETGSGNTFNRLGRYTWSYLLRRPRNGNQSLVDLWVIVYYGRPIVPGGTGETPFAAAGTQGDSSLTLTWASGTKPAVRRNTWLLDVSYDATNLVHGDFYRAVNASESGATTVVELEVPLKKSNITWFVVMEAVAEVFYRGSGVQP